MSDLIKKARADQIIEELRGTAGGLNTVLTEDEQQDPVLLALLEEEIFECEGCNWWCGRDEESRDFPNLCEECALTRP